jgi:phosphatidylglycerol:prolipoprotein diacylglycerol transferase
MGVAVTAGVVVSRRTQQPLGLTRWERLGLGIGAFCGGMLGAKLPFVLLDWDGFISGSAWFADGKTIVLGLVGGYLGVEAAKWAMDIQVKTGDGFAAPVATSIAIGRLACFTAGCCYGVATDLPWGVAFSDGPRRHPTQLYEFAFHAGCAIVLALLQARGAFRGQLIKLYIITYLIYRFATEFIRPEPRLWADLTIYQWAALALVPVFVLLWWYDGGVVAKRTVVAECHGPSTAPEHPR